MLVEIEKYVGSYNIREVHCNELINIIKGELITLACSVPDKEFLVWFSIDTRFSSFSVDIFAKKTQHTQIDSIGRNSMVAFHENDQAWMLSSSVDLKKSFTLTIFDVGSIKAKYVSETFVHTFTRKDFRFLNDEFLPNEFNLRDLAVYNTNTKASTDNPNSSKMHNIIASCFNNGIVFFQFAGKSSTELKELISNGQDFNSLPNSREFLRMTHVIKITEAGRLFNFEAYYTNLPLNPFQIFVTHVSPASVFEISINEYFNPRIARQYVVATQTAHRFIGQDVLSATEKFVAHLMFDLEDQVEVVRIYYRDESNFAYGHSDLTLKTFINRVSSIHFFDYHDSENLFVRNPFHGDLFRVQDVELMIDTKNYKKEYRNLVNKTYLLNMIVVNQENPNLNVSSSFRITFADTYDMSSYFIGRSDEYLYGYSYGDSSFSKIVSDFYYGPDLKFNLTINSLTNDSTELVLPKITPTNTVFGIRKLKGEKNCTSSFFNRFKNHENQTENIAFYCIHAHSIEKHIFDTQKSEEIDYVIMKYDLYTFIDFFVIFSDVISAHSNGELIILAKEVNNTGNAYVLHYFTIKDSFIMWRKKIALELNGQELRSQNPMMEFEKGKYFVLIDKQEKTLLFVSKDGITKNKLVLKAKVKNLDVYNSLFFIAHEKTNKIPVYKVTLFTDSSSELNINVDFLNDLVFGENILEFDTTDSMRAIIFSGKNTIEMWNIRSAYLKEYARRLPFFKYVDNFEFYVNEVENRIVFARFDKYLFVVMINREDPTDKKLF